MTLPVQFGEWLPDQPALGNPGVTRAHNVLPGSGPFYKPFPSAQRYAATSMASRPYAAISVVDNLRNAHVFGAAKTQLMTLDPATQNWSDLSRTGGYTTADIEGWRFCEAYGLVVGTNYSDNPQYIDATKGAKFADLTTLVKARYVTTLRDFILVGNTYDPFDGPVPYRVRWSAVGNPFSWDFSATTQADFQDILGGGPVQAVIGGEEGTILLKSQIVKMIYVGSPAIFEFKTIYQNKGCAIPQSVISADGKIFFFGEDGFYMLENDKLTAIGKGKVDAWFKADANQSGFERMTVSVDPINKVVIWLYASVDSFDLTRTTCWCSTTTPARGARRSARSRSCSTASACPQRWLLWIATAALRLCRHPWTAPCGAVVARSWRPWTTRAWCTRSRVRPCRPSSRPATCPRLRCWLLPAPSPSRVIALSSGL